MTPKAKLFLMSVLLFVVIGVSTWFIYQTLQSSPKLPQPVVLGQTKLGAESLYPNASYTPGDVFADVTTEEVCTPGYTGKVRSVSTALKKKIYEEYGVSYPAERGDYEVDHFIPLELGGSNEESNLWLEPADPAPGYHQKDRVENFLHDRVCEGGLSLEEAQHQIQTDWYAVYLSIPK